MPTVLRKISVNTTEVKETPTAAEIQTWIVYYLAELLGIAPNQVKVTVPFDQYGLDSSAAVGMTGDLEDWVGRKIDPTLLYDYPTVKDLAQHLAEELQVQG
ncbi:MAG TPA: phosphopantetheine-binding protein [Cyanobacteria bacterium UBA8803]|nr:phosphopantetheine-binding protein [Cyanobacteria bacterium UBA9273]HBL59564.1 phosphopantetheine-binding protein [Cyanobacteria bacterium UBA8803]